MSSNGLNPNGLNPAGINASPAASPPRLARPVTMPAPNPTRAEADTRSSEYDRATEQEGNEHRDGARRSDGSDLSKNRPRRAVVIGAGLGGLSAAIHLARQGWKVDVIERNSRSGGRMNVIREKGFTIDMGPTMLMMPEVIENTFQGMRARCRAIICSMTAAYPRLHALSWPDGTKPQYGRFSIPRDDREHVAGSSRPMTPTESPAFITKMRGQVRQRPLQFHRALL